MSVTRCGFGLPLQIVDADVYRSSQNSLSNTGGCAACCRVHRLHRPAGVLDDEVGVDRRSSQGAGARSVDHLGPDVGHVAGHPHARDRRGPHLVARDLRAEPHWVLHGVEAERAEHTGSSDHARADHHRIGGNDPPVAERHTDEPVIVDDNRCDLALDDADRTAGEFFALQCGRRRPGVQAQRGVGRPLSEELSLVDTHRPRRYHDDALIAHLPAVAVRAVDHIASPALP